MILDSLPPCQKFTTPFSHMLSTHYFPSWVTSLKFCNLRLIPLDLMPSKFKKLIMLLCRRNLNSRTFDNDIFKNLLLCSRVPKCYKTLYTIYTQTQTTCLLCFASISAANHENHVRETHFSVHHYYVTSES